MNIYCLQNDRYYICDTGQRTPCFDSYQLTITWISNIKDVSSPANHAASHDDHEKPKAWFC